LTETSSSQGCFLTKDSHFNNPSIVEQLKSKKYNCKIYYNKESCFNDGLNYIRHQIH
jgi:hypothetical protein